MFYRTRRATHNEVERRRRDNINNWIMKVKLLHVYLRHINNQNLLLLAGQTDPQCGWLPGYLHWGQAHPEQGGNSGQGETSAGIANIIILCFQACEYLSESRITNQRLLDSRKQNEVMNELGFKTVNT